MVPGVDAGLVLTCITGCDTACAGAVGALAWVYVLVEYHHAPCSSLTCARRYSASSAFVSGVTYEAGT